MTQLCLLLLFQKKKLDHIMRMIFQFRLRKFCICSFQDHIRRNFHILNLWLLNLSLLLISLIFHVNLVILFLYLLEQLLHLVNHKLNLKIQKSLFFLLMDFLHQFQIWNLDGQYFLIKSLFCKCKCITKFFPKLIW